MANSVTSTSGQKKRSRTEAERNKSLKCSNAFFHLGLILTFIGIIFTIVAMATSMLFHTTIISNDRKDTNFSSIYIPYGLYTTYGYIKYGNNETQVLPEPLLSETSAYLAAQILVIIGLIAAIIAIIIHILFCLKENMRKRKVIFIEMLFLLIAMISLLAGLSFAETEVEFIHDDSSAAITKFMVSNNLLKMDEIKSKNFSKSDDPEVRFNIITSSIRFSFYFLIVATLMFLLAFLFALVYFVRLCERINKEERELLQNLTKPENIDETNVDV